MKTKLARFVVLHTALISISLASSPPLKPPPSTTAKADPLMDQYWHLDNIGAKDAWKVSQGKKTTLVAVVDSGVDYNHPELLPNIRRKASEWPIDGEDSDGNGYIDDMMGWDWISGSNLPFDRTGHGTFMASLIAGALGNGQGGAGVCPKCSLLAARFINWEGLGDTEDAIEGIRYSAAEGASVINVSFAGEGYDSDLLSAIQFAGERGAVVVVSAGNDAVNIDYESIYPAKFQEPNMITVASTTVADELSEGSSWGKKHVTLGAPGEDVWGLWIENDWDKGSGTSQAAAVVSGAVGLIRSVDETLSAEDVVTVVKNTVRKVKSLSKNTETGGILDLAAAVECVRHKSHPCLRH